MEPNLSRKMLWTVLLLSLFLSACVSSALYYGSESLLTEYASKEGQALLAEKIPPAMEGLALLFANFWAWVLPGTIGIFFVGGLLVWVVLKISLSTGQRSTVKETPKKAATPPAKKDFLQQKLEQERKRRLYLHSLSVLQREGRLLDFLGEDLNRYEDEQIGAAVRSIQEDCKKAMKKYIDPRPVMEAQEGDTVTIDAGFDMDAIKLVGNVAGDPPFEGVLKHPGWQAGKKDVPKLSDIQDPGVMTPAEVEIP